MSSFGDFKIGQKVRCIRLDPDYGLHRECLGQVGIITEIRREDDIQVQFEPPVSNRRFWYFLPEHIVHHSMTPEEEERRLDQKRREVHANKYL